MSTATADRHLRLVHAVAPASARSSRPRGHVQSHRKVLVEQVAGPRASRLSRSRTGMSAVHLTRRGRLVVFLVVVLGALLASAWAAQNVRATSSAGPSPTRYVAVERGDTVWTIARNLHLREDIRDSVQRILELNGLGSAVLHPGQLLVVPAR